MRSLIPAVGVALALAMPVANGATADAVVNLSLEDSSTAGGTAGMRIVLDHASVRAGRITFRAHNRSRTLVHEVIVVRVRDKDAPLPYSAKQSRVIESRIRHLGEIADLQPGAGGELTLRLRPGHYLLICNQPGHYMAGMKQPFDVDR